MNNKKIYAVGKMNRYLGVALNGIAYSLPCSQIADGCSGIVLCFTNKKKAQKEAGKDGEVICLEVIK